MLGQLPDLVHGQCSSKGRHGSPAHLPLVHDALYHDDKVLACVPGTVEQVLVVHGHLVHLGALVPDPGLLLDRSSLEIDDDSPAVVNRDDQAIREPLSRPLLILALPQGLWAGRKYSILQGDPIRVKSPGFQVRPERRRQGAAGKGTSADGGRAAANGCRSLETVVLDDFPGFLETGTGQEGDGF